jgi:hypothetical protein
LCLRILREERRLKVFENRVLRRIFGTKWDAVAVGWRNIYNELHKLVLFTKYISKDRRNIWVWHVARMREKRNAYRIFGGKPEIKEPLGRPRGR